MKYIKVKENKLKVITFGGCLSFFVTRQISCLTKAKIISTVYNNRSDIFVSQYLDKTTKLIPYEELKQRVSLIDEQEITYMRQDPQYIGLHFYNDNEKNHHINFFEALERKDIDLVIIDNYLDLLAKSAQILKSDGTLSDPLFLPKKSPDQNNIILGDYLDISKSINYFGRIINFIKEKLPNAKIVFLSFPVECYREAHKVHTRCRDFNENFFNKNVDLIIENHILSNNYKGTDKQHFKQPYYSSIASSIITSLFS